MIMLTNQSCEQCWAGLMRRDKSLIVAKPAPLLLLLLHCPHSTSILQYLKSSRVI